MKTFLKIVRDSKVPKDGFYYPRAYDIVNQKLQQYCVSGQSELLNNFLDFIRKEMHVDIQWKNSYMIEQYGYYKKLFNCH